MKLRRVKPIEKHVEKLWLGLMMVVLLGVIYVQFVGGGSTFKVGTESGLSINTAAQRISARAETQLRQLEDPVADPASVIRPGDIAREIEDAFEHPIGGPLALAIPLGHGNAGLGDSAGGLGPDSELAVMLPEAPAPGRPIVGSFVGTLDPMLLMDQPGIRGVAVSLAAEQPFDLRGVTVESVFDSSVLVDRLLDDPDGAGPYEPTPRVWWQRSSAIVDVELYREEMGSDGSWGAETLMPPMPGRLSFREEMASLSSRAELEGKGRALLVRVAAQARENASALLRPRFWNMISGEAWRPPSLNEAGGGGGAEIARLRGLLSDVRAAIDAERAKIDRIEDNRRSSARRGVDLSKWVAAGPGGGRPGGGRRQPAKRDTGADREKAAINIIENKIAQLVSREADLLGQISALGADAAMDEGAGEVDRLIDEPIGRVQDGSEIRLWAHDVTAEAGKTYRYRMRVVLPNPLFGYGPTLDEGSRKQSDSPMWKSEVSDWSAPVDVDEESYLFITRAQTAMEGAIRSRSASVTAELFRVHYGYWRSDVVQLTPGDAVSGQLDRAELELPIFDVSLGENGVARIDGQENASGRLAFDVDGWYLLDVVSDGEKSAHAVLQDPDGMLVVRDPASDRVEGRLARLRSSVSYGREAMVLIPGMESLSPGGEGEDARSGRPSSGTPTPGRSGERGLGGRPGG